MATNEPVHHILDTRCIPITMPNKPGDYKNVKLEETLPFKERLTAWRARALYEKFPDIDIPSFLSGRLRDITRPLMQVVRSLSLPDYPLLIEALREVASQRSEDKQGTLDGQIVAIIRDLSPDIPEWAIPTADILERINSSRPINHKITSQFLGKRLNGMGLKTRLVKGKSELHLDRKKLGVYLEQYGLDDFYSSASDEIRQNSTKFTPSMNSDGCEDGAEEGTSTSFDRSLQESTSQKDYNFRKDNQEQELGRVSEEMSSSKNIQSLFDFEKDEVEITA